MRTLAILLIILAPFILGCGNLSTKNNDVEGVSIEIIHPANASVESDSKDFKDDKLNQKGTRYTHVWTNDKTVKHECIVEIAASQLKINGKSYGSVAKGDAVLIDGDSVKVNGTARAVTK